MVKLRDVKGAVENENCIKTKLKQIPYFIFKSVP